MLKLETLTPSVYYNQSRDFQLLGRLYELIINYIKTNVDTIYNYPYSTNVDSRLIDLVALLLGFKSKHNYNINQLMALCGAFSEIIKNKGNITSLQLAGQTLLKAEGIADEFGVTIDESSGSPVLLVFIPQNLSDINLFQDLLPYILPAGISCKIVRQLQGNASAKTEIKYSDNVKCYQFIEDVDTSYIPRPTQEYLDAATPEAIGGFTVNTTIVQSEPTEIENNENSSSQNLSEN